jgi:hypothetical protein
MAHVQQQIIHAVQAALIAADTAAAERVYVEPLDALSIEVLPAIVVEEAPQGEQSQPTTISGVEQRDYVVRISGVVAHATDYASDARDLGLQIEKVLGNPSAALDQIVKGRRITLSQLPKSGDAERARAARQQYWQFTYFVQQGAPDVAV